MKMVDVILLEIVCVNLDLPLLHVMNVMWTSMAILTAQVFIIYILLVVISLINSFFFKCALLATHVIIMETVVILESAFAILDTMQPPIVTLVLSIIPTFPIAHVR